MAGNGDAQRFPGSDLQACRVAKARRAPAEIDQRLRGPIAARQGIQPLPELVPRLPEDVALPGGARGPGDARQPEQPLRTNREAVIERLKDPQCV